MMKVKTITMITLMVITSGCAELITMLKSVSGPLPLTEAEVVSGLKEALSTGAGNAAGKLSLENGYYGDAALKILLPDEAMVIVDNISRIPGGDKLVEDVVLRINRAAEDAVGILNGADNAATGYLKNTTYNELYNLYKPKIQASTEKKLIGDISTKNSWETLTSKWNTMANSIAGRMANLKPVNTDLDDYLTNKALAGMFSKVETEELKIRKEVSARITPLLRRVFGSLDTKTTN